MERHGEHTSGIPADLQINLGAETWAGGRNYQYLRPFEENRLTFLVKQNNERRMYLFVNGLFFKRYQAVWRILQKDKVIVLMMLNYKLLLDAYSWVEAWKQCKEGLGHNKEAIFLNMAKYCCFTYTVVINSLSEWPFSSHTNGAATPKTVGDGASKHKID